jgi:hypothetical protein
MDEISVRKRHWQHRTSLRGEQVIFQARQALSVLMYSLIFSVFIGRPGMTFFKKLVAAYSTSEKKINEVEYLVPTQL